MTLPDLVVGRIVRGRHLDRAAAEFALHRGIRDDRNRPVRKREDDVLADQIAIPIVVRMHGDRDVGEHRLGPRRRDHEARTAVFPAIADMPQEPVALDVFDLRIRDRRLRGRVPVHEARAAVDQPIAIEVDEDPNDRRREALVHREAVAPPIGSEAEALELRVDRAAVFFAPLPHALHERFAPEVIAGQPFLREFAHDDRFRRDRGVILARDPIGVFAEHAVIAREHVHRRVRGTVPEVQPTGDVWRRHRDDERRPGRIGLVVKDAGLQPLGIAARFDFSGIVVLG